MVPLSKSGVRKHRGFESRPLRQSSSPEPAGVTPVGFVLSGRGRLVDYGAALEMRFGATRRGFESRPLRQILGPMASRSSSSGRWRRGAPPRTSESERQLGAEVARSTVGDRTVKASLLDCPGRARRGTSGALNLQSAPAGLNSHPRTASLQAAASSDVEDRVPRSDEPRTVSGPEGSSTKRSSSGAAERPGPSRSSWRA
jgi:hypothetical protein